MAIVPLVKDVSIKTVRDVINQKAIVLGQVRFGGTNYGAYGSDQSNGFIHVNLKNTQSVSIDLRVTLRKNNNTGSFGSIVNEDFTLAAGATRRVNFGSLAGKKGHPGTFSKVHLTGGNPASSYGAYGNNDYDLEILERNGSGRSSNVANLPIATMGLGIAYRVAALFNNHSEEKISMSQNREDGAVDITSNYLLRAGVSIPGTVESAPSKLSGWRGAQVMHGTVQVRSSRKGRYGSDQAVGMIIVGLDPIGFSEGLVSVSIAGKKITKNLSSSGDRRYIFTDLTNKNYTVYFKDELTGSVQTQKYTVSMRSYNTSLILQSYSFNGESHMLAFTT
tara:strand:+ start:679 stop:1680 length:1002 start_codon:yes stop_codon:yes gene_type:complete